MDVSTSIKAHFKGEACHPVRPHHERLRGSKIIAPDGALYTGAPRDQPQINAQISRPDQGTSAPATPATCGNLATGSTGPRNPVAGPPNFCPIVNHTFASKAYFIAPRQAVTRHDGGSRP